MPTQRLSMRRVKQLLTMRFGAGASTREIARELGVAPADCLGVEDAVAGVAAIKSAGMFALGIGHPFVLTEADVVITSLSEFNLAAY